MNLSLSTHESVRDLGERTWRSLHRPEHGPHTSFEWLDAMERTGLVRPERGWMPMHLLLRLDDRPVAVAPAYLKGNSEGEFVFDHAWARYCHQNLGREYYPKLIVASPFTPATGARLLIDQAADEAEVLTGFAQGLRQLAAKLDLLSVHILFPREKETGRLASAGMHTRKGIQYHFKNHGYETFEDFLSHLRSKKRAQVRRERRTLTEQGISLHSKLGSELTPAEIDFVFEAYVSTVDKFAWGRQYLNRAFFFEVCSTMGDSLHAVLAQDDASGELLAASFNLLGPERLYGRYWGAVHERSFLHFNVCFYAGIEECIKRGLEVFEPGAGGEHKLARGFDPTVTYSAHHLLHPSMDLAIGDFLGRERQAVEQHVEEEGRASCYKT